MKRTRSIYEASVNNGTNNNNIVTHNSNRSFSSVKRQKTTNQYSKSSFTNMSNSPIGTYNQPTESSIVNILANATNIFAAQNTILSLNLLAAGQSNVSKDAIILNQQNQIAEQQRQIAEQQKIINQQQVEISANNQRIKQDAAIKLELISQIKHPVNKFAIEEKLTKSFGIPASENLFVYFKKGVSNEDSKFKVHGRVNVDGTKQHRHIIPHKCLTNLFKNILKSDENLSNIFKNLSEAIIKICKFNDGICLTETQYQLLNLNNDIYYYKIVTKNHAYYLIDGHNQHDISYDKHNIDFERAKELYRKKYAQLLSYELGQLAQSTNDDENTLTLIHELVIRHAFTNCNEGNTVSFAEEGNTRNYEIRLYNNKQDALNPKNKTYEIITHTELNDYIKSGQINKIDQKLRVVNCEGSNVKKSVGALDLLDNILSYKCTYKDFDNLIIRYNTMYNKSLKLENIKNDLTQYNKDLVKDNSESNLSNQIAKHIAKHIYELIDYKALEEYVLVNSTKKENSIKIFKGATTKTLFNYIIKQGSNVREDERDNCVHKFPCRTEEIDKELLIDKVTEMLNIILHSYSSYLIDAEINNSDEEGIINNFFRLISLAHQIPEEDFNQAKENIYDIILGNNENSNIQSVSENGQIECEISLLGD